MEIIDDEKVSVVDGGDVGEFDKGFDFPDASPVGIGMAGNRTHAIDNRGPVLWIGFIGLELRQHDLIPADGIVLVEVGHAFGWLAGNLGDVRHQLSGLRNGSR